MTKPILPSSVTAERFVKDREENLVNHAAFGAAGKDGRLTASEIANAGQKMNGTPEGLALDSLNVAHAELGAQRPNATSVIAQDRARALAAAKEAAGPDGRLSTADAAKLPKDLQDDFAYLRTGRLPPPKPSGSSSGDFVMVGGTIDVREPMMGIPGQTPPPGTYIKLEKPVSIDGKGFTELYLGYRNFEAGAQVVLHGKLSVGEFGGVEGPASQLGQMSYATEPGQPKYSDKGWTNEAGEKLFTLKDATPQTYDGPAILFVQDGEQVFIGREGGGRRLPGPDSFHGFSGSASYEAVPAGTSPVSFTDGVAYNSDGTALNKVGSSGGGNFPDAMSTSYYNDLGAQKLYKVLNGGFAGFNNFVSGVLSYGQE